ESLDALLTMFGFVTRATTSGLAAMRIAPHFQPDIAILDLSMPDVDGLTVARALAGQPKRPFLIALTAHPGADFRRRALDAGFDYYAVKPWNVDEMYGVLTRSMALRWSGTSS